MPTGTLEQASEKLEEIIRVCTIPPSPGRLQGRELFAVDKIAPITLQGAFQNDPVAGLGSLNLLPNEILLYVLGELDITSFLRFRRVNRQAQLVASAVQQYRVVSQHATRALEGIVRGQIGGSVTFDAVYQLLIQPYCICCGNFGEFLSLPVLRRCCHRCAVLSRDEFDVIAVSRMARIIPMSSAELLNTLGQETRLRMLVGPTGAPRYCVGLRPAFAKLHAAGIVNIPVPPACWKHEVLEAYNGCISFPWYNPAKGQSEPGFNCAGCLERTRRRQRFPSRARTNWDGLFYSGNYVAHFVRCAWAKALWEKRKKEGENGNKRSVWTGEPRRSVRQAEIKERRVLEQSGSTE